MGHYQADLWAKGGGKEEEGPKGKEADKGKAKDATAIAKAKEEKEDEGAMWFAMTAFDSERDDDNGCKSQGGGCVCVIDGSIDEEPGGRCVDFAANGSVSLGRKQGPRT